MLENEIKYKLFHSKRKLEKNWAPYLYMWKYLLEKQYTYWWNQDIKGFFLICIIKHVA